MLDNLSLLFDLDLTRRDHRARNAGAEGPGPETDEQHGDGQKPHCHGAARGPVGRVRIAICHDTPPVRREP